jgi:hypothetical protein
MSLVVRTQIRSGTTQIMFSKAWRVYCEAYAPFRQRKGSNDPTERHESLALHLSVLHLCFGINLTDEVFERVGSNEKGKW